MNYFLIQLLCRDHAVEIQHATGSNEGASFKRWTKMPNRQNVCTRCLILFGVKKRLANG